MKRDEAIGFIQRNFKKNESIAILTCFTSSDVEWMFLQAKEQGLIKGHQRITKKDADNTIGLFEKRFDASAGSNWDTLLFCLQDILEDKEASKVIKLKESK
jgi:hypothetical protein